MNKPLLTIKLLNGEVVMLNENDEVIGTVKDVKFIRPTIEVPNLDIMSTVRHFTASPEITMEVKYSISAVTKIKEKIQEETRPPFKKGDRVISMGGSISLNDLSRVCYSDIPYDVEDCLYSTVHGCWVILNCNDYHKASDFKLAGP